MNWSSFVPDLLVGLFTGAVVGLALWLVQRRSEARRERRDFAAAWAVLKPRVAGALSVDIWNFVAPPTFWTPVSSIGEYVSLMDQHPVSLWADRLTEDPSASLARDLLIAADQLRTISRELDRYSELAASGVLKPDSRVSGDRVREWFNGLLIGSDREHVDSLVSEVVPFVDEKSVRALLTPDRLALGARYVSTLRQVYDLRIRLNESLVSHPVSGPTT